MAKVNMMQLQEDLPEGVTIGRMRGGYAPDGTTVYVPVLLDPGIEICRQCEGTGRLHYNAGHDGFERWESCQCENCDGEGRIYTHTEEE